MIRINTRFNYYYKFKNYIDVAKDKQFQRNSW